MAYPPGGNLTYGQVVKVLRSHGVSMRHDTKGKLKKPSTGETHPCSCLSRRGFSDLGWKPMRDGDLMTWTVLESISTHFNIEPDAYGLTAGWPKQW